MEGMSVACPACGYVWIYKGKKLNMIAEGKRVYITCPTCRSNIKFGGE